MIGDNAIAGRVSLIIVNWNGCSLLKECLPALRKQVYRNVETIVVDNGSVDDSVGYVTSEFPEITVASLDENMGFTGGNLAGLALASGEYIALLNNDCVPGPIWLSELVKGMEKRKDVGICASRMLLAGTDYLDAAGDVYSTAGIAAKRGYGESPDAHLAEEYVFGASAGAALYRRAMIAEIGFFDPDFFLVNEDTDLNFRAQLTGWKCLYMPKAVVIHKGSATRKREEHLRAYYKIRNADYALIKNMPGALALRYMHHIVLGQLAMIVRFGFMQNQWRALFRAKGHTLRSLRGLLEKRRRIQGMKRVSNRYVQGMLQNPFEAGFLRKHLMPWKLGAGKCQQIRS